MRCSQSLCFCGISGKAGSQLKKQSVFYHPDTVYPIFSMRLHTTHLTKGRLQTFHSIVAIKGKLQCQEVQNHSWSNALMFNVPPDITKSPWTFHELIVIWTVFYTAFYQFFHEHSTFSHWIGMLLSYLVMIFDSWVQPEGKFFPEQWA